MAPSAHGQPGTWCGRLRGMTRLRLAQRLAQLLAPVVLIAGLAAVPAQAAQQPAAAAGRCQRTLPVYPVLRLGDREPAVRTLQCSLNDLGVGPVAVDGYYGRQTRKAVWRIVKNFEGGPPEHPFRINNG